MKLFANKKSVKEKNETEGLKRMVETLLDLKSQQMTIREKSIFHAIDLLATTLSMAKYEIYLHQGSKSQKVKNEAYYRLNIFANNNESSFELWYKFWTNYFRKNKSLLIENNKKFYVADNYNSTNSIINKKEYKDIQLSDNNGNMIEMIKSFINDKCVEINFKEKEAINYIKDFYDDYSLFIKIANSYYKSSNIKKWLLEIPSGQPPIKDAKTGKEISYEDYLDKLIGNLFSDKESGFMLSNSLSLKCVNAEAKASSDDYLNLLKNWDKETARIFKIPESIFLGTEVSNKDFDNFITFSCGPYWRILEQNLNHKMIGLENYLKGNKIVINKDHINYHDVISNATNIDKLYADGFSHDDILEILDREPVGESWSQEHRITKNYSEDVSSNKNAAKGGDENE